MMAFMERDIVIAEALVNDISSISIRATLPTNHTLARETIQLWSSDEYQYGHKHKFGVSEQSRSRSGTDPESIREWLDYEFQKLVQFIPSNIKESKEYHARLTSKQWPAGKKIITADATAMYDNITITINHGIEITGKSLHHLKDKKQLPDDFPDPDINIILRL